MHLEQEPWSLQAQRLRFNAVALGPIHTGFQLAPIIRGAIGTRLREQVCPTPQAEPCDGCSPEDPCAFRLLFGWGMKPPRPYLVRAPLHPRRLRHGEGFAFDIVLFGEACAYVPEITRAFELVQTAGLGGRTSRFRLTEVALLNFDGRCVLRLPHRDAARARPGDLPRLTLKLDTVDRAVGPEIDAVTIRFLTPTDIKRRNMSQEVPSFDGLIHGVGRRCARLVERWGTGEVSWPYGADAVVTARSSGHRHIEKRRSTSQSGHLHDLSGFVGEVQYRGAVAPFLPWLRLGELLHVGDDTSFGAGWFHVLDGDVGRFNRAVWLDGSWPPPPGAALGYPPPHRVVPAVTMRNSKNGRKDRDTGPNDNEDTMTKRSQLPSIADLLSWLASEAGKDRFGRTVAQYSTAVRRFGSEMGSHDEVGVAELEGSLDDVAKVVAAEAGWSTSTQRSYKSRARAAIKAFGESNRADRPEPQIARGGKRAGTRTPKAPDRTHGPDANAAPLSRSLPLGPARSFRFELPERWTMADAKRAAWHLLSLAEDFEPPDPVFGFFPS